MPYIPKERRDAAYFHPVNAGELNYAITMRLIEETQFDFNRSWFSIQLWKLLNDYWNNHGQNYQAINDCSGAMHEAVAEFERRIKNAKWVYNTRIIALTVMDDFRKRTVEAYEDGKIQTNGDVYPEGMTR